MYYFPDNETPRKRSHADVLSLQYEVLQVTLDNALLKKQKLMEELVILKSRKTDEEKEFLKKEKLRLQIQLLKRQIVTDTASSHNANDVESLLKSLSEQ